MSQSEETFFTSIGCMDGRVQEPILFFGKKKFGVKYADIITEAGLVGISAKPNINQTLLNLLKQKIKISLAKHRSKGIIVHGHQDCAGNPIDDKKHKEDVLKAVKVITSFVPEGIRVIPVFVKRENDEWIVEELHSF